MEISCTDLHSVVCRAGKGRCLQVSNEVKQLAQRSLGKRGADPGVWSSLASLQRLFTAEALFLQDLAEIPLFRCFNPYRVAVLAMH